MKRRRHTIAESNRAKLTKRVVDQAAPGAKRVTIWDSELPGYGLRIEPSGSKSFIVKYRANGGGRRAPQRFMTIGRFGVLTPDAARRKAREILGAVAGGEDPAHKRNLGRREMTVAELCDLYLDEGVATKRPLTIKYDRGRIERHIKPLIGRKRINDLTSGDIERLMADIAAGRTATDVSTGPRARIIVRGGKGAASRTVGLLGGILSFAVRRELCAENPVRGVKRFPDGQSERFLTLDENRRLGGAISAAEQEGVNPKAIVIIRLLTLTGCRRNEIAALRWTEVDFERAIIRLTSERHKGGSEGKTKVVPLGAPPLQLLASLPRYAESEFVFPATTGASHFQGTQRIWEKIRKVAGIPDVRLNDLRHSFASAGLTGGDTLAVLGALLGHSNARTTSRYAHLSDNPTKVAADRISEAIASAMDGKPSADALPRRRSGERSD